MQHLTCVCAKGGGLILRIFGLASVALAVVAVGVSVRVMPSLASLVPDVETRGLLVIGLALIGAVSRRRKLVVAA